MTDVTESTGTRDRSPAYPNIPLKAAVERLVEFDAHFKRNPARPEKVGEAWGIKGKAYVDRTAAALKYFGLLEYQIGEAGRQIIVSDEGRKYLRAQQEDTKREVVKNAALRPKQIAHYWSLWGDDRPADAACIDQLVFQGHFSDQGAREFLRIYDATITFAGLKNSDKVDVPEPSRERRDPPPSEIKVGDLVQVEIGGALQLEAAARVRAVQEHEGQKWVFIEGSETGIPMSQVILEGRGNEPLAAPPPALAPTLPLDPPAAPTVAKSGEREWLRGPLSRSTNYRLIVSGDLGPKELGKLIRLLEAQKAVLSDDDEEDE